MADFKSEKIFQLFTESVDVAIFLYQNYDFIYANPTAEKLTNYSKDELRFIKFWDLIHPDYKDLIMDSWKALERGEEIKTKHVLKIITKSGLEKWIKASGVFIEYEGKRAALISAIDITKQKIA